MSDRYEHVITSTLSVQGSASLIFPGPRYGYRLSLTGGSLRVKGFGTPTAILYRNFATDNNILAVTDLASNSSIVADGGTQLWYGENLLLEVAGGSAGGLVVATIIGRLDKV